MLRRALEEGAIAKDFSEVTVGMQLVGWVKNIMPYGVFVEFPYGLLGLAPKSVSAGRKLKADLCGGLKLILNRFYFFRQ